VKVSCEQFMFTLLPAGVKNPNSVLQSVPLLFCHDVPESHLVLKDIAKAIEDDIPRGVLQHRGITFQLIDFGMGDYSFACKYQGHQGQGATANCTKCCGRFGDKVCATILPSPKEQEARCMDEWKRLGTIATPFVELSETWSKETLTLPAFGGFTKKALKKYPRPHTKKVADSLHKQEQLWLMCEQNEPLQALMREKNVTCKFKGKNISDCLAFIKKTSESIFYPSLTKTPTERWAPDMLHWFINMIGKNLVLFVREHAVQLGPKTVKALNIMLYKKCKAKPVTGYDGEACIKLIRGYVDVVGVISEHENYEHVLELVSTLSRMGDILLERYEHDDVLVDEFEVLSEKFLTLVVTHFEGRAGTEKNPTGCSCHFVDYISGRRMFSRTGSVFVAGSVFVGAHPVVRFKCGAYEHMTVRHMVEFMRKHGDLIKFSSWAIEAANKHWKRILEEHTSHGGGRGQKHIAFQAMRLYLRMVHPKMTESSVRDTRIRSIQTCKKCKKFRTLGHSKICTGQA
jgi:hypothetical protein